MSLGLFQMPWWIKYRPQELEESRHQENKNKLTEKSHTPTMCGLIYFLYASDDQRPSCWIFASDTLPDITRSVVLPILRLWVLMFKCEYGECLSIDVRASDINFRVTVFPAEVRNNVVRIDGGRL